MLRNLNIHETSGPDEIPKSFITEQGDNLALMFTTFFRAFIKIRNTTIDWIDANIVPIFKNGDKFKAGSYRPVSITVVT